MKLEVGMYVRTKGGIITKILSIDEIALEDGTRFYETELNEGYCDLNSEDIIKASHNIIDLIEAKDVLLIKDKQYDDIYKAEVVLDQDNNLSVINYDCDKLLNLQLELYKGDLIELVSVLTHEQFENNCFRIGD